MKSILKAEMLKIHLAFITDIFEKSRLFYKNDAWMNLNKGELWGYRDI